LELFGFYETTPPWPETDLEERAANYGRFDLIEMVTDAGTLEVRANGKPRVTKYETSMKPPKKKLDQRRNRGINLDLKTR